MANLTETPKKAWVMPMWMEKYCNLIMGQMTKKEIENYANTRRQSIVSAYIQGRVELLEELHNLKLI